VRIEVPQPRQLGTLALSRHDAASSVQCRASMKFTYRLIKDANGYVTECVESDAVGEGKSSKEAVESLRASLEERMFRPDAVAPPPEAEHTTIELELASEKSPRKSLDLGGPGG
jgi:hypothetical protein